MENYDLIKNEYRNLHESLRGAYPFLIKFHSLGVWAPSSIKNLYKLFNRFKSKKGSFLDLGSGDGIAVLTASLFFRKAVGIEIDKEFYRKSVLIKEKLKCENVKLILGDFLDHDFSIYDVVFVAPDKEFTLRLENKLNNELKGLLIVFSSIFKPQSLDCINEFELGNYDVGIYRSNNT